MATITNINPEMGTFFNNTITITGTSLSGSVFRFDGEIVTPTFESDTLVIINAPNRSPGVYIISAGN